MGLTKKQLVSDACWVCGVRFKTSLPPGPATREDHHIIPRNAGGEDGPEVSLCERHHAIAHKIAYTIQGKKDYAGFFYGEQEESKKKLAWLASKIVEAENEFRSDPNKHIKKYTVISKAELAMLDMMQRQLKKSHAEIIRIAIIFLYDEKFKQDR